MTMRPRADRERTHEATGRLHDRQVEVGFEAIGLTVVGHAIDLEGEVAICLEAAVEQPLPSQSIPAVGQGG